MKRKRPRKPWRHATAKGLDIFDQWPAVGEPEPVEAREAAERLGLVPIGGRLVAVPIPQVGRSEKKPMGPVDNAR